MKKIIINTIFLLLILTINHVTSIKEVINLSDTEKGKVQDASFKLTAVMATIVGVSNPVTGAAIVVGLAAFQEVVGGDPTDPDTLWNKLEERVETRIGQMLSRNRLHTLKQDVLYPLIRRAAKGNRFGVEDLEEVLDRMSSVMPTNPTYEWNYDLPLPMISYLMIMISGYHQLIEKGLKHPCTLANDMELFRVKAIYGLRQMFKLRYKAIKSRSWSKDEIRCSEVNKRNHTNKRGLGYTPTGCTKTIKKVVYEDTVTNTQFDCKIEDKGLSQDQNLPGKSFGIRINKIRDITANFLMKEIVSKINKMFTPEICLESLGCTCPEKIQRSDIITTYPRACYGNNCRHPAGRFGETEAWCYLVTKSSSWKGIKDWKNINRIDIDSCLDIPKVVYNELNEITD